MTFSAVEAVMEPAAVKVGGAAAQLAVMLADRMVAAEVIPPALPLYKNLCGGLSTECRQSGFIVGSLQIIVRRVDTAELVDDGPEFYAMHAGFVYSVALGPVTARQSGFDVQGRLARSGETWGRWYVV